MLNRGWVPTLEYQAGNLELLVFGVYFKAVGHLHEITYAVAGQTG